MIKKKKSFRLGIQFTFAALTNGYLLGFLQGKIFTGSTKSICVPGLNCYSCPGALGSCPIGALQAVISSYNYRFSFYVIGFLMAVGALFGRLICGFLCPFGLVQDLLHKIPFPKKTRKIPMENYLKYLKYLILLLFVFILPLFLVNIIGQGDPWFCKLICPSGTLFGGIPLVSMNQSLQETVGSLFFWKISLLIGILLFSVVYYRPFCKFLCPLGAIYSLFNGISIYHYERIEDQCTNCGICEKTCKLGIDPRKTPNSPECIRCGECIRSCPQNAIISTMSLKKGCSSCSSCKKSCNETK